MFGCCLTSDDRLHLGGTAETAMSARSSVLPMGPISPRGSNTPTDQGSPDKVVVDFIFTGSDQPDPRLHGPLGRREHFSPHGAKRPSVNVAKVLPFNDVVEYRMAWKTHLKGWLLPGVRDTGRHRVHAFRWLDQQHPLRPIRYRVPEGPPQQGPPRAQRSVHRSTRIVAFDNER